MTTLIAGIDASLTGCALAILDSKKEKIVYVNTFRNSLSGTTRLAYLKTEVLSVLYEHYEYLKPVFIEAYGFNFRGREFALAELGGILRLGMNELGLSYYEVAPTTLKMFVTGKGNSPKNILLEQIFRKYKVGSETLKDDNQVDAFALAKFGISYLSWKENNKSKIDARLEKSFKKIQGPCTLAKDKAYYL